MQKKEKEHTDNILNETRTITKDTNSIPENQSNIIAELERRHKKHVDWFVHHVGGVLKDVIKEYEEYLNKMETYQLDKSEKIYCQ